MKLGFHFQQTMAGAYHFLDAPLDERPIRFRLTATAPSLRRFLALPQADIEAEITMDRFADDRLARGTLTFTSLFDEGRLRYDLSFFANDGQAYTLRGEQAVLLIDLPLSLTSLPASLYSREGRELARALLRFDVHRDLGKFIKSFRLDAAVF